MLENGIVRTSTHTFSLDAGSLKTHIISFWLSEDLCFGALPFFMSALTLSERARSKKNAMTCLERVTCAKQKATLAYLEQARANTIMLGASLCQHNPL